MTWIGHPFPTDELPRQETALYYALVQYVAYIN